MAKTMTGAEMVVKALKDQGVDTVFGYPGGAVLPIYDEIFQQNDIRHILVRHEQGATHAAEGYARSTGKPGVVLVTSGPGATNAVTGMTDALLDSIPIVVLSGQVPTFMIGSDAFQEADTVGITRPCTKHNWLVKDTDDLPDVIHQAFHIATSGRPGPVLVDIPKDVQFASGTYVTKDKAKTKHYAPKTKGDREAIAALAEMMESAERPIFYTGGGVINSGRASCQLLRELVKETGFPITSTLMGLGAYPASGKEWLGMLGMHGTYEANLAMHGCDLMINIGARFDDRITGVIEKFSPNSKKAHIDIDPSSINKVIHVDLPIIGDVGHVLEDLLRVRDVADPLLHRDGRVPGIVPEDRHRARVRVDQPHGHADRGGLARRVPADEAGHRAPRHLERQTVERAHVTVDPGRAAEGQRRPVAASRRHLSARHRPRLPRRAPLRSGMFADRRWCLSHRHSKSTAPNAAPHPVM